ncbi:hypothetical protein bpr_II055 (plasmid) [Butyrivibrio proteoclasticus B316]|uniref:Uncharacterized protein n=1 Tax=Butyrivibrio proteoclasticus (strain ATCC 51982 / DSM 14932 / B316) TaxID=515622 RepID=E0S3L3_BUTPB|nr:hypothetical protein [Butyrivibrio proteoclasticus]ADL35995.1 hypothetical protein bpr_II055 [Butyrivibrio proteoclasticus B316]
MEDRSTLRKRDLKLDKLLGKTVEATVYIPKMKEEVHIIGELFFCQGFLSPSCYGIKTIANEPKDQEIWHFAKSNVRKIREYK